MTSSTSPTMPARASATCCFASTASANLIIFGEREYSLRIWLDPQKLSAYGMTAGDVVQSLRDQNVQVSGGAIGAPPMNAGNAFEYTVTTQGRFEDARDFRYVIVKSTDDGRLITLQDVARIELGAKDYVTNSYLERQAGRRARHLPAAGHQCAGIGGRDPGQDDRAAKDFPEGSGLSDRLQSDRVHPEIDQRGL